MISWSTAVLPAEPTRTAPSESIDIRLLPNLPTGEITHARMTARATSKPAYMDRGTEFFFILEGEGRLWRRLGKEEEVIGLRPGRCVSMPPGVHFQTQCTKPPLSFLVIVAPRWNQADWHEAPEGYWDPAGMEIRRRPLVGPITAWQRQDLPARPDYLAPDTSEIRLLLECPAGGVAHCSLPGSATSSAVRHRTVDEIWYVLGGEGEMCLAEQGKEEVVPLRKDTCVVLPVGVAFQFRSRGSGALDILIGTFPRWPGPEEAIPVAGHWPTDRRA